MAAKIRLNKPSDFPSRNGVYIITKQIYVNLKIQSHLVKPWARLYTHCSTPHCHYPWDESKHDNDSMIMKDMIDDDVSVSSEFVLFVT